MSHIRYWGVRFSATEPDIECRFEVIFPYENLDYNKQVGCDWGKITSEEEGKRILTIAHNVLSDRINENANICSVLKTMQRPAFEVTK